MTVATSIRDTSGPTELSIGAIPEGSVPRRSGTSFEGVAPSSLTVSHAATATLAATATTALGLTVTGPTALTAGAVADGEYVRRSGTSLVGDTAAEVGAATASAVGAVLDVMTEVSASSYDWNTTALNLLVTYDAGACSVSLPVQADVTNWPPGDLLRRVYKANGSASGINLVAGPTCRINAGDSGADMSPIPGTTVVPSDTVNAPYVTICRFSATQYYVFGSNDT